MSAVPVDLLRVEAWGSTVGYLAPAGRAYAFQYEPGWLRTGIEIAPLRMPGRAAPYVFPGLDAATFHGLPPEIADSLPDRFGNAVIDAYLARTGTPITDIGPLDRLAYLGARTMGAFTFEPALPMEDPPPLALDLRRLVDEARRVVEGRLTPTDTADTLAEIIAVGTSAGGARAKAVLAIDPATQETRAGNIPVDDRFEQWLLKFDGVAAVDKDDRQPAPFCRIEYAYSRMARAAGVEMTETRLLEEGDLAHFLTRRFDQPRGRRLHMLTLCGPQHLDFNLVGTHDYGQLFSTLSALGLESEREQVFRRMAFNVAAANHDDHTKNTAFLMDESGRWSLAPAYDLTFAVDPTNRWLRAHLMGVDGRFERIQRDDLLRIADRFAVPNVRRALAEVRDAVEAWGQFAAEAGVSPPVTEQVRRAHATAAI